MRKIKEVLRLKWEVGLSARQIARSQRARQAPERDGESPGRADVCFDHRCH